MRARQAFLQEDGTLLMNGHVYKELPAFNRELNLDADYNDRVYITGSDVPVLLSQLLFNNNSYDYLMGDGAIIVAGYEVFTYYCRADRYDELVAAIEADAPMTKMFYNYPVRDTGEMKAYFLTDEEKAAVWTALVEGEEMDWSEVSSHSGISLYSCTEDELFMEDAIELEYSDDTYYIVDSFGGESVYTEVPAEYKALFDSIVAKYREWQNGYRAYTE